MLMLFSFPSFFSFFVSKKAMRCTSCALINERNENNEERRHRKSGLISLISLISCNSFFSLFVNIKDSISTVVQNHAFGVQFWACFHLPSYGVISESQHTRCAHRALPGLAGGAAPSTPQKSHED